MKTLPEGDAGITHIGHYGRLTLPGQTPCGPVQDDFTLNSPVGVAVDHLGRVWVCDTGNSRVLIFDADLCTLLQVIDGPGAATPQAPRLLMPFHLCRHGQHMYCTDMGHGRVIVFDCAGPKAHFAFAFGDTGPHPLSDPNGIAIAAGADGVPYVYVCDEFFHSPGDERNRCVKFTLDGQYLLEFRAIAMPSGSHDLIWPQGLAAGEHGWMYLANTGCYEVLKFHIDWPVKDGAVQAPVDTVLLHSHGKPSGIGKMHVMRAVCTAGGHIFVPGQVENAISVYAPDGRRKALVSGLVPLFNHAPRSIDSASDLVYDALEDTALVSPYQLAGCPEADVYYISEPFTSSVLKVSLPALPEGGFGPAVLLQRLGRRRDLRRGSDSQFNCMSAVAGIDLARVGASSPPRPHHTGGHALGWIDHWTEPLTLSYQYGYEWLSRAMGLQPMAGMGERSFNIDAGNWCMKTFDTDASPITELIDRLPAFFMPGDLAMTVCYPRKAMFGQLCPRTPLIFVSNFNACNVSIYQFSPDGRLLPYGLPFGRPGAGPGELHAPQGMTVSSDGDIYVADSLNNRISQWRLHQSGLVGFVRNFRWQEDGHSEASFSPCDLALDDAGRVFACDQFNNCLRVFDHTGHSLWSYGRRGYCDVLERDHMLFMLPASLCIDGDCLIVNDLVNRALKVFRIGADGLTYLTGRLCFKALPEDGGVWMPYFIYARQGRVYVPDTTFNVVNIYDYGAATVPKPARKPAALPV